MTGLSKQGLTTPLSWGIPTGRSVYLVGCYLATIEAMMRGHTHKGGAHANIAVQWNAIKQ